MSAPDKISSITMHFEIFGGCYFWQLVHTHPVFSTHLIFVDGAGPGALQATKWKDVSIHFRNKLIVYVLPKKVWLCWFMVQIRFSIRGIGHKPSQKWAYSGVCFQSQLEDITVTPLPAFYVCSMAWNARFVSAFTVFLISYDICLFGIVCLSMFGSCMV